MEGYNGGTISKPLNNPSLYYKSSEGIWRDTTPTH